MLQDSNNKNIDKNFKLMALSAVVLLVLFIYTIYKSSSHITGSSYYIGIIFLFILLFLALFLKLKQDQVRTFFSKYKKDSSAFDEELNKTKAATKVLNEDLNSNIQAVTSNITFKDVAGINEIKEELEEVVDFLNHPQKYLEYGIKLPKGVLLVGPPGVGKTLIARAVAGEADVPFFYQSGASFVQIYVGMGAKKVRELFAKAKQSAPAIIFIDEIDAVGKARSGKSNDERESTLNELLTQMDGFDGESGVIVIAATNKIEVLDDALLRAGRFDRRVHVGLPNINDRKKILELYLNNKNYEINIDKLVNETAGFSSAALATLINEALLNMIKNNKKILDDSDILIAKNKLEFGKKQIKILDDRQKEILAIYQASKAFISKTKVALFDESVQKLNSTYPSYYELCENIKRDLAGFIGLEVIEKEKYAINSEDLERASKLANDIVNRYKMVNSVDELLTNIKNELRSELSQNVNEINRLKQIMLKNEVITFEDI
ncbi:integral membrane ATP-dependent zinc metallopeptidase [Arcobacter venerupis]|uniref:Integral membrane ATP-dependent zinc metallopeptidase n=1 Tax=Arcobacter venerupis TaxID=1054033 RepID=A0AAE7B7R5_9BACT|nr:AAA family ATPase [Arcobacter venerupis]QKF66958.1 integral membrane ATP-dependent zinc metallopeptidase [Arcobacter venerupis]RWS50093.1 cell division protein FtsH [Arcobacter venerupis]